MGLDVKSNFSLWRDKALIELNYAILYSFQVEIFFLLILDYKNSKIINSYLFFVTES